MPDDGPIDFSLSAGNRAMRRPPSQYRSLRTVSRILKAASSLLTRMLLEDVIAETKKMLARYLVSGN